MPGRYALLIPALNEADSIGRLLAEVPQGLFSEVIVVDNGSGDATAEVARQGGARVVHEPRRGYGQACLTGLRALPAGTEAVAFIDADLSDDPADLGELVRVYEEGCWNLVIGSRVLGDAEPGSLAPLQRFGNWLATGLIQWLWGVAFTDLGPMRMVSCDALLRLQLEDRDFGWTVEMQAKAALLGLRATEVPVRYRRRTQGQSKVSGTVRGSLAAGTKILWTIYRCWLISRDFAPSGGAPGPPER